MTTGYIDLPADVGGTVDLTTEVTGILPIANGGTGSATQNFVDLTTAQSVAGLKNFTDALTITSNSANSLAVGPNGTTNPALQVDSSIASQATGIKITGAAAGGGVTVAAISSGANEELVLSSKGSSFARIQVGGSSRYSVNNQAHVFANGASSTASTVRFSYTGGSDVTLTASTEAPNTYFNMGQTRQHATGALTLQRDFRVSPSTHSFVGASTLTSAAAFSVDGPANGGTNATITNSSAIHVPTSTVTNVTNSYGLSIAATTGATNNYAGIFTGGSVGIGTTAPAYTLDVNGSINAIGRMNTATSYAVPTATDVVINLPNGTSTLTNGYSYIFRLVTIGTGVLNGSSWLVYQTAAGVWTAKMIGAQSTAANHPLLKITGTSAYLYHNHASSYTITATCEAHRNYNTTILSPYYYGVDGVLTTLGGKIGMVNVPSPTYDLSFYGNTSQQIGLERNLSVLGGSGLTISAGGAYAGGTDLNGGILYLTSGTSTGTGTSSISFRTATASTTGTADNLVSQKMVLMGDGKLGIGTASPGALLDVSGTATALRISSTKNGTWTVGEVVGELDFYSADTSSGGAGVKGAIKLVANDITGSRTDLSFHASSNGTNGVELMRLVGDTGNVGIGTNAPSAKLHISDGTDGAKFDLTTNGSLVMTTTNSAGNINLSPDGTLNLGTSNTDSVVIGRTDVSGFTTRVNSLGGETMRIIDGNVGIGVTSPNANAILDVVSTTKASMPVPRMTTAQKGSVASPAAGMMVYDTTLNKLCVYTTAWETITSV